MALSPCRGVINKANIARQQLFSPGYVAAFVLDLLARARELCTSRDEISRRGADPGSLAGEAVG